MIFGLTPDYLGRDVVWSSGRLEHIQSNHPVMATHISLVEETLLTPDQVRQSTTSPNFHLYYRWYTGLDVIGDKYICVVARVTPIEVGIITAYPTDRLKRGGLRGKIDVYHAFQYFHMDFF